MTKKINYDPEINLAEVFFVLWKNKLKIIFTSILFISAAYYYYFINLESEKINYKIKTSIKSISSFQEFEYKNYNNYIQNPINFNNPESRYLALPMVERPSDALLVEAIRKNMYVSTSNFQQIDKAYLMELFLEKLNEDTHIRDLIKKSDLIQKDNYESINEYNNEVLKIAEKIKIISTIDNGIEKKWVIETTTDDTRKWQDFLKLMEKNTNLEVKNFLIKNFNLLVESQEEKRKYFISDIDETIKFAKNDFKNATRLLQSIKKVLIVSKDIERLKKAFITTPLINQSEFYAGRILDRTSVIKNLNKPKNSKTLMLTTSGIFGLFISSFFVLLINSMRKSKK